MKISKLEVKIGVRKYCLWFMALMVLIRLPITKWMITVEEIK